MTKLINQEQKLFFEVEIFPVRFDASDFDKIKIYDYYHFFSMRFCHTVL